MLSLSISLSILVKFILFDLVGFFQVSLRALIHVVILC